MAISKPRIIAVANLLAAATLYFGVSHETILGTRLVFGGRPPSVVATGRP
ncbi:MAG: hypothetical protein KTU85_06610 [Acidimicrobiia bacterium]|nr:hypothetical protein [Acidimicrobiia bacterium]